MRKGVCAMHFSNIITCQSYHQDIAMKQEVKKDSGGMNLEKGKALRVKKMLRASQQLPVSFCMHTRRERDLLEDAAKFSVNIRVRFSWQALHNSLSFGPFPSLSSTSLKIFGSTLA